MKKRKLCVVTSSRADYGHLKPLLNELKGDHDLCLQIAVTGMHLSPEFGLTYREIENDGFEIDEKIEVLLSSDTPQGISKSMGLTMISFSEAYQKLNPDIIVAPGDRFEMLSVVATALVCGIPVAHISGGDVTEGAIDDSFRHSITKMSHLHFTSLEQYRKRVIQLGEDPTRVFKVGELGLDNIKNMKLLSKSDLEKELKFKLGEQNLLVNFHPVTLEKNTSKGQFQNLLDALDGFKDVKIIFTKSNADTYGRIINQMMDQYAAKDPGRVVAFTSLGQLRYLSAMQYVDGVVGNSSSGIIEAPSFQIGTVNIGDRQKGRVRPESVIDCGTDREEIKKALRKLFSKDFKRKIRNVINPYGDGNAAKRIKDILKKFDIGNILKKKFHDLEFEYRR